MLSSSQQNVNMIKLTGYCKVLLQFQIVIVVAALYGVVVVKHGILLKLRTDALFQFLDRQFDELDGLDLKRRQLLGLFQFESLLDHSVLSIAFPWV